MGSEMCIRDRTRSGRPGVGSGRGGRIGSLVPAAVAFASALGGAPPPGRAPCVHVGPRARARAVRAAARDAIVVGSAATGAPIAKPAAIVPATRAQPGRVRIRACARAPAAAMLNASAMRGVEQFCIKPFAGFDACGAEPQARRGCGAGARRGARARPPVFNLGALRERRPEAFRKVAGARGGVVGGWAATERS